MLFSEREDRCNAMKRNRRNGSALLLGIVLLLSACGSAKEASIPQAAGSAQTVEDAAREDAGSASPAAFEAETASDAETELHAEAETDTTAELKAASDAGSETATETGTAAAAEPNKTEKSESDTARETETGTVPEDTKDQEIPEIPGQTEEEAQEAMLQMTIDKTKVKVKWEDNESVRALMELCREEPLTIQLSMYGGFEQVGQIGTRLPSSDVQTRTEAGDIVLYASSQIVVFYGSNSWAYTRLGHIEDPDAAGMAALLGNGDVAITLSMEK